MGMITVGEACLLGVVQGLTEFLPVSSDGHLALTQHFITPMPPEEKLAIDVALHAGTLVALVLYFWADLWGMLRGVLAPRRAGHLRTWAGLLVVGTLPALVGLPLRGFIAQTYESLGVIGAGFLVTGTLLWLASAVRGALRDEAALGWRDALTVGAFQVLALLPGVSRSGTTIAAGLFRRIRPETAARFSFLLGIPAVAGALLVEGGAVAALGPDALKPLAFGVGLSLVTGLAAIWAMMRLMRGGYLHWFAYYCWTLGALVLVGAVVA
jgi:undecaprenyl-diphosphatase